ncbi:hypothetical protein HJA95_26975 [Rhizobium binae]|uniref:hypothetical protein n=1 Tax=Rhizobium binae TaxID=1138190 RepID=UPI001C83407A|nr:hypothetical protein [Rhizobium binae]MBX4953141.1 hypothetical protein [Rhizobium binae]MBX4965296.1 hypothetical protein [Rhizobium binae]
MPGLREVQYYLAGLWLLIRMDPRGFRFLDLSERGVNRSFWAMVWCLPPMGISWLWWRQAFLRSMPPDADVDLAFFIRLGLVEIANWIVPLVFAGLLLLAFRMGERFAPVVVSVNWLGVPLSYINGLLLALVFFLPGAVGLVSLLLLAFMLAQVFVLARILRMICHDHALMVGALTLVLLVPSMILSEYLQHFLGIYPA